MNVLVLLDLGRYMESMGLRQYDNHFIPQFIFGAKKEVQSVYLRALFSADGTVLNNISKGSSVRLSSSYPQLLNEVQKLLINFGIASKIYFRKQAGYKLLPDGHGGSKEFWCKDSYELIITKNNIVKYNAEIGFLHDSKKSKLNNLIDSYINHPKKEYSNVTFDSLGYVGAEEVFDLTEPMTHSFIANGLLISNCSEEALEDFGSCNLASINLGNFTICRSSEYTWDYDRLMKAVSSTVRMLNRVVDKNNFPLQELYDMNQLTRRIGLGVMGWADALIQLGIRYDSEEGLQEAKHISKFISKAAWKESEELAIIDWSIS